jgi:hypothetical protein
LLSMALVETFLMQLGSGSVLANLTLPGSIRLVEVKSIADKNTPAH